MVLVERALGEAPREREKREAERGTRETEEGAGDEDESRIKGRPAVAKGTSSRCHPCFAGIGLDHA